MFLNISEKRPEIGAVVIVKNKGAFTKAVYSEEVVEGSDVKNPVFTRELKNHKDRKLDGVEILSGITEWKNC